LNFFARQKVDEIGIVGVKLQKILLFLLVVNALTALHGNILLAVFAFIVMYIGFYGALKRNERLLRFYFVFNVTFLVVSFVATLFIVFFFMSVAPQVHDNGIADTVDANEILPATFSASDNTDTSPLMALNSAPVNSGETAMTPPQLPNQPEVEEATAGFPLRLLLCWVFGIVVFALKITSIVLAGRMSRMLRERNLHNLAHPIAPKTKDGYTQVPQQMQEEQAPQIVYIQVPMQVPPQGYPYPQAFGPMAPQYGYVMPPQMPLPTAPTSQRQQV